jgi:nitric oxide reductase NorQ protein
MSKIAVFVETYTPSMGADHRQMVMVPFNETVRIYSRLSDGGKGTGNRWEETTLEAYISSLSSTEYVTKTPVAVRVTDNDTAALEAKGYPLVLCVKAVNSHVKSPADTGQTNVVDRVTDLYNKVLVQDSELEDMIIDLRSSKSATTPFLPQQEPAPTQTIAAHDEALEPVFQLASVPPMERAKEYVNRDITGLQDFEIYDKARENKLDVLIYGPTGPGKTSSVVAWAAARKLRMATVSGNAALEPSQLIGKYIPDGKGGFMWIDGPVTDVVRNGGVLCLDEVNFISPKIYTVLYSLLDARRALILLDHKGETIEAHKDLTIFATMNPSYIGTTPLNFAFRNRFAIQIPWDYDDKVEAKLVNSQAILTLAKQLRNEAAKGELETPISTNMLMELERFVSIFGHDFAVSNFVAHFDDEEQEKVRLVMTTHEHNIKADFEPVTAVIEQPEDATGFAEKQLVEETEEWISLLNNPQP